MAEVDFKRKCAEVMAKADFTTVSSVKLAYEEVYDLLHFQEIDRPYQPLNPNSISRPLSTGKGANTQRFSLTLYLIIHGKLKTLELINNHIQKDGLCAYRDIQQTVSEDVEVRNITRLLSKPESESGIEQDLQVGLFEEKTALYALRSARISAEPEHEGIPPKCVLGFMKFTQAEAFSGKAFIYFGEDFELRRNGNIASAESALFNSQGVVVLLYKLERKFLGDPDGNPLDDREGFINIKLESYGSSVISGAAVFDGHYKDIDPNGVNVDGRAYVELFDSYDADLETLLKQHAESFLQKVQ